MGQWYRRVHGSIVQVGISLWVNSTGGYIIMGQ